MKKVLSLVLIMCLLICSVPVFAEGNTLSREELFDRIEALANKNGFIVYRSGASLVVQNGSSYFAISNDKAAYMENGLLAEENIYVDGAQVKYPEDAIETFFGVAIKEETIDKSAHDKEIASYDEYNVMGMVEKWETPYGTIIHTGTKGVMHGSFYNLSLIRWDGTYLGITKDAPQMNQWTNAPWDELEISDDGKLVKVTYHGNANNFVIEANLETGEVISGEQPIEYDYTIDKDKLRVTINAYKGSSKKVVIPDEIEGMPVEIIARGAFSDCDRIKEVVISKNVFEIANRAFEHCENLKTVTFLNPYTYIAEGGFKYVYSKEAPPYVPHGFKEPDFPGFYDCDIETVYGYEGSTAEKYFTVTDFKALEGKGKAGREYASVEDMANFIQASSNGGVNGKAVFTRKNVVLTINAGEKQAEISYLDSYDIKTFELEEVSKTASHVYIKDVLRAFDLIENTQDSFVYNENDGCISIKKYTGSSEKVVIPDEIDGMPVTKIGTGAFSRCETIKELIIPEGVQKIDHMAVVECVNLEAIVILNPYVYIASVDLGKVYEEGRPPYTPHGVMMKYPAFMSNPGTVYGYRNSTADKYFSLFMPLEEGEREARMIEAYELAQRIGADLVNEEGGHPNVQIVRDGVTISMRAGETEVTKKNWNGEIIETITWETAVEYKDGKYYVPIEELLEAFGLLGEGSGLMPIRTVFDKLGISGSYGNGNNAVEATRGRTHLYFCTGEMRAFVNGEAVVWKKAAEGTYPDYYVPAEDVMKAFKLHLEFNPVTNEVDVVEE